MGGLAEQPPAHDFSVRLVTRGAIVLAQVMPLAIEQNERSVATLLVTMAAIAGRSFGRFANAPSVSSVQHASLLVSTHRLSRANVVHGQLLQLGIGYAEFK